MIFDSSDTPKSNPICEFLFTGRRFDTESELYFYRARYYNPQLGRFISRDPKGYVDGSLSLYEYCCSGSTTRVYPYGEVAVVVVVVVVKYWYGISSAADFVAGYTSPPGMDVPQLNPASPARQAGELAGHIYPPEKLYEDIKTVSETISESLKVYPSPLSRQKLAFS